MISNPKRVQIPQLLGFIRIYRNLDKGNVQEIKTLYLNLYLKMLYFNKTIGIGSILFEDAYRHHSNNSKNI